MLLTLNDGTQFEVSDNSNLYEIFITTDTETMKEIVEEVTTNNLKHATMGEIMFVNAVVNNISVSSPNSSTGEVNILISLGVKTDIDIINERLDEQDAALMELAELIAG